MSDSDNASDFESADDGDDLIIPAPLPSNITSDKEIDINKAISVEQSSAGVKSSFVETKSSKKETNTAKEKVTEEILHTKDDKDKKQHDEHLRKEKSSVKEKKRNKNKQEKIAQPVPKEHEEQKPLTSSKSRNRKKNKKVQNVESKEEKITEEIVNEKIEIENENTEKIENEILKNENQKIEPTNSEQEKVYVAEENDRIFDKLKENQTEENISASTVDIETKRLSIDKNVENEELKLSDLDVSNKNNSTVELRRESKESTPTRSIHDRKESHLSEEESRVLDKLANLADKESQPSGWGWGNWGASLLSTATASVTTFTNQVGQGIATVIETVEGTLGALPPEEMARQVSNEKRTSSDMNESAIDNEFESDIADSNNVGSKIPLPGADILFSGVTNLTSVIQNTGKHFVTGSLDALETIGKKTMDVLQDGDPGLKKKRALFQGDKGGLSQVLREAKEKAEANNCLEEDQQDNRKANFGIIFDDFQGLVHLEALEMLSSQSDSKLKATMSKISGDKLNNINDLFEKIAEKSLLDEVEDIDENSDHQFTQTVSEALEILNLGTSPEKLILVQSKARTWLDDCKKIQDKGIQKEAKEIHENGIAALAELTARTIEQLHKSSELLLLKTEVSTDHVEQASSLTKLTNVLCTEVGILSAKYAECLNTAADDSPDPDSVTPLITDMFLEASNSSTYIQDAFQLTIPILQLATLMSIC